MRFESRDLIFALLAACIIAALPAALQWRSGNFSGSEKETARRFPLAERQLALKAAEDLLMASASLASERGLVLAALSAPEPVTSAGRATINERRSFADAAVE